MNQQLLNDMELAKLLVGQFNVRLDIAEVIVRPFSAGMAAEATIFKTKSGHVLAYIASRSAAQLLADVRTMLRRMQCEVDFIYPPRGDIDYFDRNAREKFKAMFPGKHITSDEDLRYYKSIAPYNPALVQLSRINGRIDGFDRQTRMWRKVKDYTYSKIKSS